MSNFSKATISPEAAGMSETLKMLSLMTELQKEQYDAISAGVQTEGQASIALGSATKSALENEADSVANSAYGSIAGGLTSIAAEGIGGLYSSYKTTGILGFKGAEIKGFEAESASLDKWSEEFAAKKTNSEISRQIAEGDADQGNINNLRNETKAALRAGQKQLKNFEDNSPETQNLKQALLNARAFETVDPEMKKSLDDFEEGVEKQKESLSNKMAKFESGIDRFVNRFSTLASGANTFAQGAASLASSNAKKDQADQELIKVEAQYVQTSMDKANQTAQSLAQSTESNKKSLIDTLLKGLADSNRV